MSKHEPRSIRDAKVHANRLLRDLRSRSSSRSRTAAFRLQVLPFHRGRSAEDILAHRHLVRRKHALEVIAREAGFKRWEQLCASYRALAKIGIANLQASRGSSVLLLLMARGYEPVGYRDAVEWDDEQRAMLHHPRKFMSVTEADESDMISAAIDATFMYTTGSEVDNYGPLVSYNGIVRERILHDPVPHGPQSLLSQHLYEGGPDTIGSHQHLGSATQLLAGAGKTLETLSGEATREVFAEIATKAQAVHADDIPDSSGERILDRKRMNEMFIEFEMQLPDEVARSLAESSWDDDEDESQYDDHDFLRSELRQIYEGCLEADLLYRAHDWGLAEQMRREGIIGPARPQ